MAKARRPLPNRTPVSNDLPADAGPVISRGKLPSGAPMSHRPGAPAMLKPAFQFYTPQQAGDAQAIIEAAIQQSLDHYSVYTQAKTFTDYDIAVINIAANTPTRLDTFGERGQNTRRALLIINNSATNVLFVGKSNVGINQGIPIPANFGTYLVSMRAEAPHFGYCAVQTTATVVWYL